MPAQSRRPSTRPSRAQRRAGTAPAAPTARQYSIPSTAATPARTTTPTTARRYFSAEPAPIDYGREFGFVSHDLRRILIIAGVLIVAMIALTFVLTSL